MTARSRSFHYTVVPCGREASNQICMVRWWLVTTSEISISVHAEMRSAPSTIDGYYHINITIIVVANLEIFLIGLISLQNSATSTLHAYFYRGFDTGHSAVNQAHQRFNLGCWTGNSPSFKFSLVATGPGFSILLYCLPGHTLFNFYRERHEAITLSSTAVRRTSTVETKWLYWRIRAYVIR